MYQYGDTGKVYGYMPSSIDEQSILRHVGWNAKREMTQIYAACRQDRSVQSNPMLIGREMNGERIHIKHSGKHLETCGLNTAHQQKKLKADINQVEQSRLHLSFGCIGFSIQEVIPLDVDTGVMSHMGERG
jgi:hypothetical protein